MYEHNTIRQIGTSCSSNNIFLMILEQRVQPMYNIGMKLTLKYKDPAYVQCTLSPLCVYLRSNRQLIFRNKFNATTNKQTEKMCLKPYDPSLNPYER